MWDFSIWYRGMDFAWARSGRTSLKFSLRIHPCKVIYSVFYIFGRCVSDMCLGHDNTSSSSNYICAWMGTEDNIAGQQGKVLTGKNRAGMKTLPSILVNQWSALCHNLEGLILWQTTLNLFVYVHIYMYMTPFPVACIPLGKHSWKQNSFLVG